MGRNENKIEDFFSNLYSFFVPSHAISTKYLKRCGKGMGCGHALFNKNLKRRGISTCANRRVGSWASGGLAAGNATPVQNFFG